MEGGLAVLARLSWSDVSVCALLFEPGGCGNALCNSPSRTSFQEHLACFLVQPMHAVRFFKQSMCNLRHLSHGGRIRSPFPRLSILWTISALKGPPSSFSAGWLVRWLAAGSRLVGVFGMGTGEFIIDCSSASFI
jgi:hypothetical protein